LEERVMELKARFAVEVVYNASHSKGFEVDVETIAREVKRRLEFDYGEPYGEQELTLSSYKLALGPAQEVSFVSIQSSNLDGVAYIESTRDLFVRFKGGAIYRYFDVPSEMYSMLMESPSHGKFFNRTIKPHYIYEKV
jgi:hypothetical protein